MIRKPKKPKSALRSFLSMLAAVLPHVLMILMGMLLTFCIIDMINPAMDFINNDMTKGIMMASSVISFVVCGMLIYHQRQ